MKTDNITGIVETIEGKHVTFSMNKKEMFDFCFITTDVYKPQEIKQETKLRIENGLIHGKTSDNHDIAIYYGKDNLNFFCSGHLKTAVYFISRYKTVDHKIEKYRGIMFKGGILKSLFLMDAIEISNEDGESVLKYKDDSIIFKIDANDLSFELMVDSSVSESRGLSGNTIKNDEVNLYLKFDKEQSIDSFFRHYNKISELVSFMTYRKNIYFDEIYLMDYDEDVKCLHSFAEAKINEKNYKIDKNYNSNITFEDLGESLPNLLKLLYDDNDKKEAIMLGFLPKNNRDVLFMNDEKIKTICSALECELKFFKNTGIEKNIKLEELINIVKNQVREFRESNDGIPESTYSLIFNSIEHWSLSLSKRISDMCKEYKECTINLPFDDTDISEIRVQKFVKYRNDITHGRHRVFDMEVGLTSYLLSGIVYCNILDRIGVERTKIIELSRTKLLR